MRHLLALFLAIALVSGPLVLNPDRAEAMIAAPGLKGASETIYPIEKAWGWHHGGWGWHHRWHRGWGWHRGWHHWRRGGVKRRRVARK
jgi:hypothetical protein